MLGMSVLSAVGIATLKLTSEMYLSSLLEMIPSAQCK